MDRNLLSLKETRLLTLALNALAEKVRAGGESPKYVEKTLREIAGLKAALEAGDYCETGSEETCASTRAGTFW
jgi:hypothetical protein